MASRMRRRSYTAVFKLKVVEFAEKNSNRIAEKEFDVNEKQRDWKKKKAELQYLPALCRSQRTGVKPCWPELEDKLHDYNLRVLPRNVTNHAAILECRNSISVMSVSVLCLDI